MALWSLITYLDGGGSFSTQLSAATPSRALHLFLVSDKLGPLLQKAGTGWPKAFAVEDIVAFLPLTGLKHIHVCQVGKNGKYAMITLVKTAAVTSPNSRSNGQTKHAKKRKHSSTTRRSPKH
jgi:hypothetical protein